MQKEKIKIKDKESFFLDKVLDEVKKRKKINKIKQKGKKYEDSK